MAAACRGYAAAFLFVTSAVGSALAQTKPPSPTPAPPPSMQEQRHQAEEFYRTHYTKHEYHVAMRDGVKLYTVVYSPIAAQFADRGPYPFLMSRTPYSCGNYNNDVMQPRVTSDDLLTHDGYILVCQDVRGRWDSEGTWLEMTPSRDGKGIDESTDMSDTVDWLLKNIPNNNGKVGILGISYPGFYAAASIVDSNPAIKAASPQAPIMDLWMGDDAYHGGAFMLDANHSFYAPFFAPQKNPLTKEPKNSFEFPTQDMYAYYLHMGTLAHLDSSAGGTNPYFHDQVVHSAYGPYWQARDLTPHMHGVKGAVLEVGGWFDAEDLAGPVQLFHSIAKLSPEAPENTLVEGPWVHGGWSHGPGNRLGDITFPDSPSAYYRENIEAPFFAHWLKDRPWTPLPVAYTYETGTDVWKKYDAWPPKQAVAKTLFLEPDHGLGWSAPTETSSSDSYISDPAHPVPFVPYVTGPDVPQRYMDEDQRFATHRGDVLVYETAPLTEDVTVVGPIKPHLKIASTGTDSDFIVKLIDVYPEDYKSADEDREGKRVTGAPPVFMQGYEMMVRGEPFRAKYRNSWEDPEPLTPGKITDVDFSMQDVNHTFLKGHRIMVQIQSSWFPLVDRNPQVFMDISKAQPEDFHIATETVFHQADAPSSLDLLVMPH
ncbi:MAG TPA: CocE/NonD family hydrolase [Candidatus Aquilonibacter sp.]|nr:CocE/NonD family hydrolase [Candidatus Aquilonibacter sp.]